ncbi:MAG: oligoendopeptidase F [Coriobacteriales bacterium]|jgi:oligoendopeptidase F
MQKFESRDQIEERYRWNLADIYADDEAFLASLEAAGSYPERCLGFQGTIAGDPAQLLAFLRLEDEIGVEIGKLMNYASRKSDEDTRVSTYQDYESRVMLLYTQVAAATSWATPELLTIDDETMAGYYEAQPELELYRRALDMVFRRREHTLGQAEEAILASSIEMAQGPGSIFSLLNDADLTFKPAVDAEGAEHPVTHGSYIPLMMSPDRALRKSAFESLYETYGQFRNTCAATLGAQLKQQKFYADMRRYPSTLAHSLDGTEVPTEVYTNLIDTVHKHLPTMHRYIELRKRLLAVDELHFYDLYVPVVADVEMEFTYEEACETMLEALAPMGEAYVQTVREALDQRWIDVYENPGKRSGAYSAGSFGMHPYMLLNFQGQLDDVFTLVHEMGHSMHTHLSCANQPAVYSDYVIFVAEVASTCNEALLMQHLLGKTDDKQQRAYLLNHFLEQFRGTLYRQCMFAEFELAINELVARGEGVTADALCALYRDLNEQYYGPGIVLDEQIALEWARIPHFYYEYYVYQYATGYAAAIALSNRILAEGAPAVEDYLGFLKGGSSRTPIELLKGAGVDMATPAPIDEALNLFAKLLDEMEELVG